MLSYYVKTVIGLAFLAGLANLGVAETQAHGRKSGWYTDQMFGPPAQYAATVLSEGRVGGCDPTAALRASGTAPADCHPGATAACPPAGNALLRVWVSDEATVWVNGQVTKPQTLAGVYRGSRIFSLTGLKPGTCHETTIEVQHPGHDKVGKTEAVQAGQCVEVRFVEPQPTQGDRAQVQESDPTLEGIQTLLEQAKEELARIKLEAQSVREAQQRVAEQAALARKAANDAAAAQSASEQVLGQSRIAQAQADSAAAMALQAARQAARTNSESFEFAQNNVPVVAWVKYLNDGGLSELLFDGPSTPSHLEFRETSGAHSALTGVEVAVQYRFVIQVPDAQGDFQNVARFESARRTAIFQQGTARVPFFARESPEQLLSAQFRELLRQHWSQRFAPAGRVKVEIVGFRPNGQEVPIAPVGNRLTIEMRRPPM